MKQNQSRLIILGAGRPFSGEQHSVLRGTNGRRRVLDWLLHAMRVVDPSVHFVGGYQLDEIAECYPELHYSVNPHWQSTGAAASLLEAPLNDRDPHFISYADVLFRDSSVACLSQSSADIAVLVDSGWRHRFEGRSEEDRIRCEKVNLHGDRITRLGRDILPELAEAEFVGLVRLSPAVTAYLMEQADELPAPIRSGSLTQLLELLRTRGFSVQAVDVAGDWAELNQPDDLSRFILGTKAQTLHRLQGLVTHSRIEDQVSFTVADWQADELAILDRIQTRLVNSPRLVVRSSALSEDGFGVSNAGAYTSVLGIELADPAAITAAVAEVIASYPDGNPNNQVLVQPMLEEVLASGVAFTKTLAHGAPYYVINYDDTTSSTESITSGASRDHKTLFIHRDGPVESARIPERVRGLLPAMREIEDLLEFDSLDIEFALTAGDQVHILQVRPIAVQHELSDTDAAQTLLDSAVARFRTLQKPAPFVVGQPAVFGIMPDWNPAEIIGTRPGRLASSLYRYLIMDEVWATQRAEYGYRDVRPQPLLAVFAGHPYVDIRASFNSFVPRDLDDALADKLVTFYLDWLVRHPHLHDKVEFDVVPTCYGLDFDRWRQRLLASGRFDGAEVDALADGLKTITHNAITRTGGDLSAVEKLASRYDIISGREMDSLDQALALLEDCRRYGTLTFSHLARSAFVAVTLLRSGVAMGVLSQPAMDAFLNSIRTVSHRFTEDAAQTASGDLSWADFVSRYGHLRPGTYDITSPSYADQPEHFLRPVVERASGKEPEHSSPEPWLQERERFAEALAKAGLDGDADTIERFMREAIEGREYAKFVFTRHLSRALDCLARFGKRHDLERDQIALVPVEALLALRSGTLGVADERAWLLRQVDEGREALQAAAMVELPPLLTSEQDFYTFLYAENQANFIGKKRVSADCVDLQRASDDDKASLAGKIALIPQADPGYDWLFGHGIAGLITMYGGANSHMAIRAAEFGLPAAIGVGEALYGKLASSAALELDPANQRIQVVR